MGGRRNDADEDRRIQTGETLRGQSRADEWYQRGCVERGGCSKVVGVENCDRKASYSQFPVSSTG
jgi:hypothetical protein